MSLHAAGILSELDVLPHIVLHFFVLLCPLANIRMRNTQIWKVVFSVFFTKDAHRNVHKEGEEEREILRAVSISLNHVGET